MHLFKSNGLLSATALPILLFVGTGILSLRTGLLSRAQGLKAGPITPAGVAPAELLGDAFAMVAMHIRPAVVSVYSEKLARSREQAPSSPFGDELPPQLFGGRFPLQRPGPDFLAPGPDSGALMRGMGSGMILDKEGHILTNDHVVKDVDEIKVRLADGRQFEAELVSTDPRTDVAVIRIRSGVPADLPIVQLGDSDRLRAGDVVMAVGAPFGLTQTVTQGIISATGRSDVGIADFEDFLQTDAPINPGNSGGPLVNMRGEVIGMNSAIATSVGQYSGVGFAIPINMIQAMLPTLAKGGSVTRGMLGVIIQDVDAELAQEFQLAEARGALVAGVNRGSPAEAAGFHVGDVIVRLDGKPVQDRQDLRNRIAAMSPGSKAKLEIARNGKNQTLTAEIGTLASSSKEAASASAPSTDSTGSWGITVQTLTSELASQLGLEGAKGVLVTGVHAGGVASRAGMRPGDVIAEVDHRSVGSMEELREAMSKTRDRHRALLLVQRAGGSLFIVMQG